MTREIKFRSWDKILKIMSYNPVNAINFNGQFLLNDGKFHDINKTDYILMQYTGLVDKNGKDIYEGDIVKYDGELTTVIFFNGSFFLEKFNFWSSDWVNADYMIVKGNIYENPELIGGGND